MHGHFHMPFIRSNWRISISFPFPWPPAIHYIISCMRRNTYWTDLKYCRLQFVSCCCEKESRELEREREWVREHIRKTIQCCCCGATRCRKRRDETRIVEKQRNQSKTPPRYYFNGSFIRSFRLVLYIYIYATHIIRMVFPQVRE